MRRGLATLPRVVFVLGGVSLLTDLSSEMIYPLLPVFLTGVLGAGPAAIGIVEGLAESLAAWLRVISGRWSDRIGRRVPLVVGGYTLSGAARPLIGLAGSWPAVLALRAADRIGKGIRGAPRDALIADATPAGRRGIAFGVQRAMDHTGAVAGPLVAAGLLAAGLSIRGVILAAAVPATVVVVLLLSAVREPTRRAVAPVGRGGGWRDLGPVLRLLPAVGVFTLGNATDAFLLLRFGESGLPPGAVAVTWAAHNLVKVAAAGAGGMLTDRIRPRTVVLAAWILYAGVYAVFAAVPSVTGLVVAFLIYGAVFGLAEPAERAWIAQLAPVPLRATAYGAYHAVVGIAALPGSVLFGAVWERLGAPAAFTLGAALALVASGLLGRVRSGPRTRLRPPA